MNIREAFSGGGDRHCSLSFQRGEDRIKAKYEDALKHMEIFGLCRNVAKAIRPREAYRMTRFATCVTYVPPANAITLSDTACRKPAKWTSPKIGGVPKRNS